MMFCFQRRHLFKLGITAGKEWGPNRSTFGIIFYLGFRVFHIWFGKNPWKLEPTMLTEEELREAEE